MIPERNNYWLLDSVAKWQIGPGNSTGVYIPPGEGDITLDPLPGNAKFLESSDVRCIACPVALAAGPNGTVMVMDGKTGRIVSLHPASGYARPITGLGGIGKSLRHFKSPRSMTVLPSGAIGVADFGNQRVQLFSGPPYALLHVWGEAIKPLAVASDKCGVIYIADQESRMVLRVSVRGDRLSPLGEGILKDPLELAVGPDRTVAVVDGRATGSVIVIFPPDGGEHVTLRMVRSPLSLAFDAAGNLYTGTANAIISKLRPDNTQLSGWTFAGDGVSDVDGSITKLAWVNGGLIGILVSGTAGVAPRLLSMDPAGAFERSGSFLVDPLDSEIETCTWHRVKLNGTIPNGTSVSISTRVSEDEQVWTPFEASAVLTPGTSDCLVQSPPGRYLQISVGLQSTGAASPRIHSIQVFFPRQSYLEYLPAVFQDDDESRLFLDRFLSIFQTTFDNFDNLLDNLPRLFDPLSTPEKMLPWLSAWMALPVDPSTTVGLQRKLLKSAFETYRIRGTVKGLEQVIEQYSGIQNIRILEHFKLRNWAFLPVSGGLNEGARLWSENFYGRLEVGISSTVGSFALTNSPAPASEPYAWGANQFSVLFPADPYTVAADSARVRTVLNREQPAFTQSFLCPIFPRLRVGVQATLGVDAYLGKANAMVLNKVATLGYDSVLARSEADRNAQALGVSLQPRVGENARLL
jgi:phage tail-like protein